MTKGIYTETVKFFLFCIVLAGLIMVGIGVGIGKYIASHSSKEHTPVNQEDKSSKVTIANLDGKLAELSDPLLRKCTEVSSLDKLSKNEPLTQMQFNSFYDQCRAIKRLNDMGYGRDDDGNLIKKVPIKA